MSRKPSGNSEQKRNPAHLFHSSVNKSLMLFGFHRPWLRYLIFPPLNRPPGELALWTWKYTRSWTHCFVSVHWIRLCFKWQLVEDGVGVGDYPGLCTLTRSHLKLQHKRQIRFTLTHPMSCLWQEPVLCLCCSSWCHVLRDWVCKVATRCLQKDPDCLQCGAGTWEKRRGQATTLPKMEAAWCKRLAKIAGTLAVLSCQLNIIKKIKYTQTVQNVGLLCLHPGSDDSKPYTWACWKALLKTQLSEKPTGSRRTDWRVGEGW